MPKVSAIIPAYNAEKTLRDTIQSVRQQTFTDWELIVIDDGSTDSTADIIKAIPDDRIHVFSFPNAGLAESRNRGIDRARGEFVAFLDADDLWTTDKLAAQVEALEQHPEAAVAYSWTDYIDESGQFLRSGMHVTANGDVYQKLLLGNFLENGSNPLIRKQAFQKVGQFDKLVPTCQDWDMYLRLSAQYPFVAVPFPQVLYRVSPNSMSFNFDRHEAGALQAISKTFATAPQSLRYLKKFSLANFYKYMTFKSLDSGELTREKGLLAARYLWHFIKNDPSSLRQTKVIGSALYKIAKNLLAVS
ncbi:glycosyltransferase [Oscillatoria sp. FACHB-1406]|uniref:glycosyltransferase family 2 protein n=1 Tax=Oscillatoria sp. FACHB-1406 TaxID=2692846 RepID=UPI001689DFCA|nr:glycosyltransferase [Oscillatoria sp. FACHB-1406]MBD2577590.1 glycosyltransferase [Oscillatoria sp. FACHB-1406]